MRGETYKERQGRRKKIKEREKEKIEWETGV